MSLIFEKSKEGRFNQILEACDVEVVNLNSNLQRKSVCRLPQISESDLSRHYTELAKKTHGVNDGFYPLGSCTMKYNPKLNEVVAGLPGFNDVHPLQPIDTVSGCIEALIQAEQMLCEVTGMDEMTFQPAAGAQGEFCGLLLMKAYHHSRNEKHRTKVIVPDAAHGTNPASANMAGYSIVNIPSTPEGIVDVEALRSAMDDQVAGLMLTNPNTLGIFDKNILEITQIIHDAGGVTYYDGANLNPILGIVRPGDMGFDIVHLNLHKTFSTPHGGGGPGSGPVGCKSFLAPFLPPVDYKPHVTTSMGRIKGFNGNFLVTLKALTYLYSMGADGLKEVAQNAVLNANYMRVKLEDDYDVATSGCCMHEFVISLQNMKKTYGVSALDIAKALLDYGIHPPTMYFPLVVAEALMIEPTETESKETLDEAIQVFKEIITRAKEDPSWIHETPHTTPIKRPDEVLAARSPVVAYRFDDES